MDLCRGCYDDLPLITNPCIHCGLPLPPLPPDSTTVHLTSSTSHIICGECSKNPPSFDRCIAPLRYQTPVSGIISGLKFSARLQHAPLLGNLLAQQIRTVGAKLPELIIPVPLHKGRLRQRGFNQALELSRVLSRQLDIPIDQKSCVRHRPTDTQSQLEKSERSKNMREAFSVCRTIKSNHIALVDDVVTTGSTVSEITKLLKQHGVETVDIWAVARTL